MKLTRHHRKPRVLGGKNEERNISFIPQHKHRAWHLITRQPNGDESTPGQIAQILNEFYLDPDYMFVVRRRK